jgi:hypothetical protein
MEQLLPKKLLLKKRSLKAPLPSLKSFSGTLLLPCSDRHSAQGFPLHPTLHNRI